MVTQALRYGKQEPRSCSAKLWEELNSVFHQHISAHSVFEYSEKWSCSKTRNWKNKQPLNHKNQPSGLGIYWDWSPAMLLHQTALSKPHHKTFRTLCFITVQDSIFLLTSLNLHGLGRYNCFIHMSRFKLEYKLLKKMVRWWKLGENCRRNGHIRR